MSTLTPGNQVPTPLTEADVNGAAAKFTLTMVEGEDIYGYTLEVMGEWALGWSGSVGSGCSG